MKRDSMVIYRSYYEAGRFLSDKERLDYYDRILNYWIEWVEKKKCEKVEMLFSLIKPNIDSNNIKYTNWSKWGRPSTKKPVVSEENNQRFWKTESNVDVDEDVNDDVDVNEKDNDDEKVSKETAIAEYGDLYINKLEDLIKKVCKENNILYSGKWKTERNALKRLLSKKMEDRLKELNMSLSDLIRTVIPISANIKYWKTLSSGSLIYYHREEIYNKAQKQHTTNRSWVSKF